jgi:hypothetical protein
MRALACSGGGGCYWAMTSGETSTGMTTNNAPMTQHPSLPLRATACGVDRGCSINNDGQRQTTDDGRHTRVHYPRGYVYPPNPRVPLPIPAENPYPRLRVRVSTGAGTGSEKIPGGYPCQSLLSKRRVHQGYCWGGCRQHESADSTSKRPAYLTCSVAWAIYIWLLT